MSQPIVSIIVGSASDADTIAGCRRVLDQLEIPHEARVLSAHRTPRDVVQYVEALEGRGIKVVIAGAGMAAHLAGVVAAHTRLPVLGVPIASGPLQGVDALLSTSQMPPGVPVATFGVGKAGAKNAAWFAARLLSLADAELADRLVRAIEGMRETVLSAELPTEY